MSSPRVQLRDLFAGALIGTAVGDALGLPAENLSPEQIRKRWSGPWRMRFVFGKGMISDDTEHTLMAAQALLSHPDDPEAFQRALGWKFRWWFAGLPGGVGLATAKACLRLWLGFPARKAAVASAGSGPAMRSAIIGAYFDDAEKRRAFTLASSRLTHRGWQAETAALAISEAAAAAVKCEGAPDTLKVLATLRSLSCESEWQSRLSQIQSCLGSHASVANFIDELGLNKGVTGYSLHVVPVALYAWLRHSGDFRTALTETIQCGGDTDTVAAILGALLGVTNGPGAIPADWRAGIWEWPRSIRFMEKLAERLAKQHRGEKPLGQVRWFWPGIIPRNLLFLAIVLSHGFRRLLP